MSARLVTLECKEWYVMVPKAEGDDGVSAQQRGRNTIMNLMCVTTVGQMQYAIFLLVNHTAALVKVVLQPCSPACIRDLDCHL